MAALMQETGNGPSAQPIRTRAGRLPLQLLGASLFFAWEILIAPFEQACGVDAALSDFPRTTLNALLTAGLLVAAALRARSTGRSIDGRAAAIGFGACALAAALLDLTTLFIPAAAGALACVSVVPKAAASAGLFLMWGTRLAGHRAYAAWTAYAASFVLTVVLFFAVRALGTVGLAVAMAALPAASCALLETSRSLPREAAPCEESVVWRFPWRPVVLMAAFSFAYRLVIGFGGDIQTASELGRLAVSAIVLACFLAAFDRFDAGLLYRVCPALVVAGLVLCLVEPGTASDPGVRGLLVSAGYSGFTLYVYMTLNTVCFRFGAPSDWLFGMTRATCVLAGMPAAPLADALATAPADTQTLAVGGVVVALVLLSMLVLTDRRPVTTWGIKAVRIGGDEVGARGAHIDTVGYLEDRAYRCALVARHFGLTHREEEVLSLLAQGMPLQQIEDELSIAHGTMRAHVQHIYAKLGVHSHEEARAIVRTWQA